MVGPQRKYNNGQPVRVKKAGGTGHEPDDALKGKPGIIDHQVGWHSDQVDYAVKIAGRLKNICEGWLEPNAN
ncbi:MAG: hypothetical protein HYY02_03820 [Chloroflexi bacterium]|nr:hypothetical protein [Chloroflexota bacterium]